MRYVWMVFVGLLVAMALVLPRLNRSAPPAKRAMWARSKPAALAAEGVSSSFTALREGANAPLAARADSVVAFGLAQRGTPYVYAGTSPLTGFDCSGFIMYTFARFGVDVPHSTALLINVGQPVERAAAQRGDIVVFTGTSPTSTTPGHAGIVITERGEVPLRFVHSSSARRESGVKVSQVEGTDYERRFMQVRRVLGPGAMPAARPGVRPGAAPRSAAAIAALPARTVPVEPVAAPAPTRPTTLPVKKVAKSSVKKSPAVAAKKKPVAKKAVAKKPVARRKTPAKRAPAKTTRSTTTRK
ncbi:C40 family peptidase [Hymenobacter humi]|uniref:C40 family peptidase n=1 Tax=Hymenobacter humi TaxID=1411620 RepID=A0ABW2U8J1_9BACT